VTTDTKSGNDILMGGGSPAAKFPRIGAIVDGIVAAEPTARQQTEFRTKAPEFWKDGSPKMQVLVELMTDERDPAKADDDGTRTLYIKGKELTKSVRDAVRQSGADGIHTGGRLTVQYVADGPQGEGAEPPKLYASRYVPPAVSFAGVGAPATQAAAQPAVVQQQFPPVQQQVTQSILGAPAGVDPAVWARMNPQQQQTFQALDDGQRALVLAAMGTAPATVTPPF
jgi:hypothetical protein